MEDLLSVFIFFFAVIDPIGSVPVFLAVTRGFSTKDKKAVAWKAVVVAGITLTLFIAGGEIILNAIDVPLSAFQIAGGIILFLFALTMIFGDSKPEEEIQMATNVNEKAIFPMAIPSIASPGAMLGAVLLTKNSEFEFIEQFQSGLMMWAVLAITLVLLLLSTKVDKIIGNSGAILISRIMGLLLASIAINSVLAGIRIYYQIP